MQILVPQTALPHMDKYDVKYSIEEITDHGGIWVKIPLLTPLTIHRLCNAMRAEGRAEIESLTLNMLSH